MGHRIRGVRDEPFLISEDGEEVRYDARAVPLPIFRTWRRDAPEDASAHTN